MGKASSRQQRRGLETAPLPSGGGSIDLGILPHVIGYNLRRAQLAVFQDLTYAFAELDIRPTQYGVLTVIGRNPGLKQAQVSEALGIQRTNLVVLLDTLEARGLARREPVPEDRRAYALYLTAQGQSVLARLRQLEAQHEHRLERLIGLENVPILQALLKRLADGCGGEPDDATERPAASG